MAGATFEEVADDDETLTFGEKGDRIAEIGVQLAGLELLGGLDRGVVDKLTSNARPLGLFDDSPYAIRQVDLGVGDRFLLYTDGLSELFAERAEQRNEPDLETVLRGLDEPPEILVASLFQDLAAFKTLDKLDDDVTYLAGERI